MCVEHLDRLMQEKMEEWRQVKRSQVKLWMLINTIGMSNCVPEVKQWAPIVRDFKMGDDMLELVQKPLHRKNFELERKIANQRLPPSSTWIILEAVYNWMVSAIQQVVNFTSCDRTTAARILRNHNWNAEQAINGYVPTRVLASTHRPN
ncbi:putative defective in cullin neddylation protein 1 protein [Lasiodiplodia theobromae]|uniref:Defective in cullin neddylation protein 1 protein n=1 Tax=Lasiodiplodia theobromae TaxID=45133 RepID=A0A8H7IPV0_9PEZI|nr:putative defective in cullin neddylation protein 1 protein [Lasiodiplodia theobromae]